MLDWWNTFTQDNKVNLITPILIGVLAVVDYLRKGWFESPAALSKTVPATVNITVSQGGVIQTNKSGQNIVNTGSGTIRTIIIGIWILHRPQIYFDFNFQGRLCE